MSKNRKGAGSFGSRSGKHGAVVRGNTVKVNGEMSKWFDEMETMLNEASAMPSAATIVIAYNKEYGAMVADPAAVTAATASLNTVIRNHQEAIAERRTALQQIRDKQASAPRALNNRIDLLVWADGLSDVMNDFGTVGMYAIDNALDPFRELAAVDSTVPMPAFMIPRKEGDRSIAEQYGDASAPARTMTILDVPPAGDAVAENKA